MAKRLLPAFGSCLSCELAVADAPKIACYSTEAIIGDKNVHVSCEVRAKPRLSHTQTNSPGAVPERVRSHVSCEVRAKPRLSALFWIVDANGTALAEGEVVHGHWTLVLVGRPAFACPIDAMES